MARCSRSARPSVQVVDTTGAGDAFAGALAAALDRGADWRSAIAEGVAAGSLACTAPGAQPALPDGRRDTSVGGDGRLGDARARVAIALAFGRYHEMAQAAPNGLEAL